MEKGPVVTHAWVGEGPVVTHAWVLTRGGVSRPTVRCTPVSGGNPSQRGPLHWPHPRVSWEDVFKPQNLKHVPHKLPLEWTPHHISCYLV